MADFKKSMEMLGRIVDLNRPPAPQRIIRASDAFSPFVDKAVGVTMADRTKAEQFGKFKGGARFPFLQNVDPAYQGQTWGFGKKGMATRMHGQFEDIPEEELLISTILGKKDMLKSNPEVFSDLVRQYKKGMKSGLLTDELRAKTNKALSSIAADDTGKLMFGPDVDIGDPAFFKSLDTFDKRREVGNILGGVGVGGKKGQLFDYDAAIKKYIEPSLYDAPNMSVGSRIFTLSGTKAERPDLNPAYPHVVGGLDLGVDFTPVPRNTFLKDYHEDFMSRGKVPGWYNITQSSSMPYQKITDEWLQHLKDRGYAEGGEVEHMQAGGVKKAVGALGALSKLDAEENLARWLSGSPIRTESGDPKKLFHITTKDFDQFRAGGFDPTISGHATWLTDSSTYQPAAHNVIGRSGEFREGTNVMPVYSNAKNPLMLDDQAMLDWAQQTFAKGSKEFPEVMPKQWADEVKDAGYGYIHLADPHKTGAPHEYIMLEPEQQIKSAIGNRGTYDPNEPSITKAEGGKVEHMQAGGVKKALGALEELAQAAPKRITHSMLRRRGMGISSKDEADALYSSGHRIFGMHEMDEIPFEITDRKMFDNYAPDLLMAYPPEKTLLKADGGEVEHMQFGGLKNLAGAGAKILPKAERDLNLTKFLEDSALKQRLYHGSNQMRLSDEGVHIYAPNEGFSELLPSGTGVLKSEFDKHPPAVFLSPNPDFASRFAGLQVNEATPAVYPVHAKVKNPFDYANQAHMDALEREYIKTHIEPRRPAEGESLFDFKKSNAASINELRRTLENAKSHDANWNTLEDAKIQQAIRNLGHDAFYVTENGVKNIGVYDPKMIKSATGNQGTYDITTTELNKAHGGQVEHMQSGGLKTGIGLILPEVENAIAGIKEVNRMPIIPMPNRWFLQPDKFPQMQGMVEKVLQRSGLPRESFTSGAYANPVTGEILDRKIFEDVGVAINPATNRPMMSAGKEAGIEELEKELGSLTRSNLVRKGLFKRTGGDKLLDDINFLATIERSGMGHKYGLATEYGSPTQMFNTGKSGNPTLRPTSRGDVFGMGDVLGQIQLGKGPMHDVYEKLFVAPKGMDVPGVKLHEAEGGAVNMQTGGMPKTPVGGELKHTSFEELRHDMGMAEGGDIMHKLVKYAAAGGEIDDLQHTLAKKYLETLNG
jgi:hypothetical protein